MLVLLAEDEADLAELTIDFLAVEGIDSDFAANGKIAMNLLEHHSYDAVVLDITMPKVDGLAVCSWLKERGDETPVIFLTARDSLDDKLVGFRAGADDYLTKPFELDELVARLKVLARRQAKTTKTFELDSLLIDFASHQVTRNGELLKLKPAQMQLLCLLAENSPNVVKKAEIEQSIWPEQDVSNDMFKNLAARLRVAIDMPGESSLVQTIRGVGLALRKL